jgi:hypothetical protein
MRQEKDSGSFLERFLKESLVKGGITGIRKKHA